jgi:hypothetical protein
MPAQTSKLDFLSALALMKVRIIANDSKTGSIFGAIAFGTRLKQLFLDARHLIGFVLEFL